MTFSCIIRCCLICLTGLFLCFLCDDVADYLDNLDDEHQNDNCGNDNVVVVTLNALNIREVSEAASADCASHRGESDEVYQGDRNTAGKSRNALAEVHSENDPELGAAHRLRRLDKTGVYSGERRLSLAGEERNSSDDERENRTGNSDGGTAYDTRQRDKRYLHRRYRL